MYFRLSAIVLALFLPMSASAGLFDDEEARRQVAEARQQIERLQQQNQQLSEQLTRLEASLKDLKITEILNQLDGVRAEVSKVRGQLEVQNYQVEQLQKRQKDLYADIDTRIRNLESADAKASEASSAEAGNGGDEVTVYSNALNIYKLGNYAAAASAFQGFLERFPNSKLVPNAMFWAAAAQAAQKDCKSAVALQQKLLSQFPENSKTPETLLGMASCQMELKDNAGARKTLQQLIAKYPSTPSAEQGKKLQTQLGKSK